MFAGAYLLGSTGIRFKDRHSQKLLWLPGGAPVRGKLEPKMVGERAELVYQMVPGRMKNLVIINSNFGDFECIQTAADAGEKYADNVIVITPLLSRLTYALNDLAEFRNPPNDEVILVLTITSLFSEFIILRRDRNFQLYIAECISRKPGECMQIFLEIYKDCYPHATILLTQLDYADVANNIKNRFEPENCFIKIFKRWDFSLLYGGLFYAMNDEDFDPRYHIQNFASGIETTIGVYRSRKRHIILPDRSPIPCELHGIDGTPQPIQLFYFHEYLQVYERLVYQRRPASKNVIRATGSSRQVIGYVDEKGVPYAHPKNVAETQKSKDSGYDSATTSAVKSPKKEDVDSHLMAQPETFSPANAVEMKSANVKFIFENNVFAIEVYKNGVMERIENSEGNEWTPLYFSMATGVPEIGDNAKADYQKFPERVIYDVLKIIGKPMNEITIDPDWGFKLVEENNNIFFEIETPSGAARFPQELVLSVFMKTMKLQAASALNDIVLSEIRLSTNFKLSESQKAVFKKAAQKNTLEIFSFIVSG
uniref:Uncharacterized protein n=1 Tax=Panagrolaimus superbus TaxID=310955 RepID=A0A914YY73_9BILA